VEDVRRFSPQEQRDDITLIVARCCLERSSPVRGRPADQRPAGAMEASTPSRRS
jgi:hypothetical protein